LGDIDQRTAITFEVNLNVFGLRLRLGLGLGFGLGLDLVGLGLVGLGLVLFLANKGIGLVRGRIGKRLRLFFFMLLATEQILFGHGV